MKVTPYALTYAPNFKWAPLEVPNSDGKAWIKILGKDEESGAKAALVKYDAGFCQAGGTSEVYSDSIVVDGGLTLDGKRFNRLGYWYRPAGTNYGPIAVEQDTTRFVITGGRDEEHSAEGIHKANVEDNDGWEVSERGSAWSEKTLRIDEKAGHLITYQSANMFTMFLAGTKWVHPDIEEAYCIEGAGWDYVGEVDTFVQLKPGTYIYRRPNETFHGTATTFDVPRRIFVKYYNSDLKKKFARSIEKEIVPASISE